MSLSLAGNGTVTGFDAGASGFGGLVAVKHVLKTDTQVESSVAGGANFAVTDLSITHTLADAANKLIISAYLGAIGTSEDNNGVGISVADDGTLIGVGNASGSRVSVGAGGYTTTGGTNDGFVVGFPSVTFVYEPGDTASHTYTVRAHNVSNASKDIYINRNPTNANDANNALAASGFVIQEVAV